MPSTATSSTVRAVAVRVVPSNVKFASASNSVVVAPTVTNSLAVALFNAVIVADVIEVAPVTTPASILIVPSSKIADPEAGSIFIAAPESKVNTPAESMSTVPSAVI